MTACYASEYKYISVLQQDVVKKCGSLPVPASLQPTPDAPTGQNASPGVAVFNTSNTTDQPGQAVFRISDQPGQAVFNVSGSADNFSALDQAVVHDLPDEDAQGLRDFLDQAGEDGNAVFSLSTPATVQSQSGIQQSGGTSRASTALNVVQQLLFSWASRQPRYSSAPSGPKLCLNPAAVAALRKVQQLCPGVCSSPEAALQAAAANKNPDGSYIPWYTSCGQLKK